MDVHSRLAYFQGEKMPTFKKVSMPHVKSVGQRLLADKYFSSLIIYCADTERGLCHSCPYPLTLQRPLASGKEQTEGFCICSSLWLEVWICLVGGSSSSAINSNISFSERAFLSTLLNAALPLTHHPLFSIFNFFKALLSVIIYLCIWCLSSSLEHMFLMSKICVYLIYLLYSQCLDDGLVHGRHPIKAVWINEL